MPGGHDVEDLRALGNRPEQMVERRHAPVVQVRDSSPTRQSAVSPHILRSSRGRLRPPAGSTSNAATNAVGHESRGVRIGADVLVNARPVDVPASVVNAVTARAADRLRVEQLPASLGQLAIDLVRIRRRPQMLHDRLEFRFDPRDHDVHQRVERADPSRAPWTRPSAGCGRGSCRRCTSGRAAASPPCATAAASSCRLCPTSSTAGIAPPCGRMYSST